MWSRMQPCPTRSGCCRRRANRTADRAAEHVRPGQIGGTRRRRPNETATRMQRAAAARWPPRLQRLIDGRLPRLQQRRSSRACGAASGPARVGTAVTRSNDRLDRAGARLRGETTRAAASLGCLGAAAACHAARVHPPSTRHAHRRKENPRHCCAIRFLRRTRELASTAGINIPDVHDDPAINSRSRCAYDERCVTTSARASCGRHYLPHARALRSNVQRASVARRLSLIV